MKKLTTLIAILSLICFFGNKAYAGSKAMAWIPLLLLDDKDKVTGSVTMLKNGLWLHSFSFVAQEMGDEPLGKGFLFHQRLNDDGTTILREEQSMILYIIVDGNEAWFTGPISYDSTNPNPTRWFVVYVWL